MLSLTARGLTTGDIAAHFDDVHGAKVSKDTISRFTYEVLEELVDRQHRPLDRVSGRSLALWCKDPARSKWPYRNRAWVLVDGDQAGLDVVESLRRGYQSWPPDHFDHFDQPHFERYYPAEFKDRVDDVLAIPDHKRRKEAKEQLLLDVVGWLNDDRERAKTSLATSAASVIDRLRQVERQLSSTRKHLTMRHSPRRIATTSRSRLGFPYRCGQSLVAVAAHGESRCAARSRPGGT